MLIEFRVANFRSIKEEQTFSMVASKDKALIDSHTFETSMLKYRLLHSAAIYGANASGKTNLLQALSTMRIIVVESAIDKHRGHKLPVQPFKLDHESLKNPTEFEVLFIVENIRYRYGFSATEERIVSEWLFAYPEGRPQRWFERDWDNGTCLWDFGPSLKGEKKLWKEATRDNALFLSTAVQLNSQSLQPVYDWFKETFRFVDIGGLPPDFSANFLRKDEIYKGKIIKFLNQADLAINDIAIEQEAFDPDKLRKDIPEEMKQTIIKKLTGEEIYYIRTVHKDSKDKSVEFGFDEESHGTQKIFSLAGPLIDVLERGCVLCIDELSDHLHPKLVEFLLRLFNSENNTGNAQLVFTTHETNMLNQEILRRDQIWFCEKDKTQSTQVYPLTDFHPRKGRENLELTYLSGGYGGLPYISEH